MRRMLDPKEAGGSLPSTITFDEEGNRTIGKNLTISGDIKKPEFTSTFTNGKNFSPSLGGRIGPSTTSPVFKPNNLIWDCETYISSGEVI